MQFWWLSVSQIGTECQSQLLILALSQCTVFGYPWCYCVWIFSQVYLLSITVSDEFSKTFSFSVNINQREVCFVIFSLLLKYIGSLNQILDLSKSLVNKNESVKYSYPAWWCWKKYISLILFHKLNSRACMQKCTGALINQDAEFCTKLAN